ncbi:MAG: T9SS type A sorting domain-containing protein, partial [Candidatus Cloacimonetes bacterium]|nr:T9SS type A sorting domain-containing protein [Candidatus Cloacimonadota bacterium]
GIPVTPLFSSNQENFDANIPLDSNEIAIVWESIDAGFKQIYTQAIDFDGNYLWSNSNGLIVGQFPAEQQIPKISSVNNSGIYEYYIGWEDFTDFMESQIKGQKVINGELQWGDEGITIADRTGDDELSCLVERYYIWRNIVLYPNYSIYAKLVDEDGNTAPGWDENGNLICGAPGIQTNPRGIIVPEGLLIIWEDYRDFSFEKDIYGQVITPDGTILWQENGLPLVTQENDQYGFKFVYDNGLYITWSDFRSGSYSEIYIQKYDEFGNELWQEGGILIAGGDDLYTSSPDVVKVGDKILVVWEENNDYFLDIKAQLLNENGELLWNPQGLVICDEFRDQSYPQVVSNGDNDTFIAWLDNRAIYLSGGFEEIQGVYAQKVYIEPTSVENEIVPKTTKLFPNFPNPFNPETTIYFTAENAENAETCPPWRIVIYNIKGQKVKTLNIENCKLNIGKTVWNGTDENNLPVSSGIYFYKLRSGNFKQTRKMILLK